MGFLSLSRDAIGVFCSSSRHNCSEGCMMDSHFRRLCWMRGFRKVTLYLSLMWRVVEFSSSFSFPRSKQIPDFFLNAKYLFCHDRTNRHQSKKFQFYFNYSSVVIWLKWGWFFKRKGERDVITIRFWYQLDSSIWAIKAFRSDNFSFA